jgi:hypothetical protein
MMIRASIAVLSIFFAQPTVSSQSAPADSHLSRADTLEILTQVARKFWDRPEPGDTAPLFPSDEMASKALRHTLLGRSPRIQPALVDGEWTTCPSNVPEPTRPSGWIVKLRVLELKSETFADLTFSCGHGWGNAFATGFAFKVRREKNRWVVGEIVSYFITKTLPAATRLGCGVMKSNDSIGILLCRFQLELMRSPLPIE